MPQPRVSLGLPVYNGEDYLEQAIESILNQTFASFELIISDNASSDRTGAICEKFITQDERVRYFRHPHNLGAAPNYNYVVHSAQGEYFKWAAHDDLIAPEYLAKCVSALDRDPDAVVCYTGAKRIDEASGLIQLDRFGVDLYSVPPAARFCSFTQNPAIAAKVPLVVFGLIRSGILRKTGLIRSFPSSDVVLVAELALFGRLLELPEPLFGWRHHPKQSIQGRLASDRLRTSWFDTSLEDKIVLHKWMYLNGYLDAIERAPISRSQKRICRLHVLRWGFMPANLRSLVKDVVLAGQKSIHRTLLAAAR